MKKSIITILIVIALIALCYFIDYKIATSNLPFWFKFMLLR